MIKVSPARRHLTYLWLLNGLELTEDLARQVCQAWLGIKQPVVSVRVGYKLIATPRYSKLYYDGVRSIPNHTLNVLLCDDLAKRFDLEGIAGFYFDGLWKLNLDPRRHAAVKPYRDSEGRICGLLVYSYLSDKNPRLLTSRGFNLGTKAEPYYPYLERSAA